MLKNYINIYIREFSNYNKSKFFKDLFAGITVAAVSLPLAMVLGIGNGTTIIAGILSSIFGGLILSLIGATSFQINGAAASTIAVLIVISKNYGESGVFLCGLISGLIILICYFFKIGHLVIYIPEKVICGLMTGIGLITIINELPSFIGLNITSGTVVQDLINTLIKIKSANLIAIIIGIITILMIYLYPKKLNEKFPVTLSLLIVFIIINFVFKFNINIVDNLPGTLITNNKLTFSFITLTHIKEIMLPSISLAIIIIVKSTACGISGEKMKKEKFDTHLEIFALGITNIIIPFLGCVPSAGSISSTQISIKSGQQTRFTGFFNSITLILILLLFREFISVTPMSVLSGILITVGIGMIKFPVLKNILIHPIDNIEFIITVILTLFSNLSVAIFLGILAYLIKTYINKILNIKNKNTYI